MFSKAAQSACLMMLRCHDRVLMWALAALDAPQYQFEGFLGKVFLVFHSVQGVMSCSVHLDHCWLPARHCDSQVAHACTQRFEGERRLWGGHLSAWIITIKFSIDGLDSMPLQPEHCMMIVDQVAAAGCSSSARKWSRQSCM